MRLSRDLLVATVLAACIFPFVVFASNVTSWSTSAASNNSAAPNGFPEGMAPSGLNDAAREVMAAVARWYEEAGGALTSGGAANAYTLTTNSSHSTLAAGDHFRFEANHTNTGAATLAVDSAAADSIVMPDGDALAAGAIQSGGVYTVVFDGTNFQVLDSEFGDIARTDGNIIVGDGTDWVAESGATARTSLGIAIGSDVQAYDADLAAMAALANTNSNFIVGNGSTWVAESGATARTSLGLGSLATASTINNGNWSGTDLAVTNGGTGSSTASGARTNLGIGSMAERDVTIQNGGSPSGGSDGDVFFIY